MYMWVFACGAPGQYFKSESADHVCKFCILECIIFDWSKEGDGQRGIPILLRGRLHLSGERDLDSLQNVSLHCKYFYPGHATFAMTSCLACMCVQDYFSTVYKSGAPFQQYHKVSQLENEHKAQFDGRLQTQKWT